MSAPSAANGVIRGCTTLIDTARVEPAIVCVAEILPERQTEEFFTRFDAVIRRRPDVHECHLMTGDYDSLVRVEADSAGD